jgi:hypothetical protein
MVSLNGDGLGTGASGACRIAGNIWAYYARDSYGENNEPVTIQGYTDVLIEGDILTYFATTNQVSASRTYTYAGDITITNITGDIEIRGVIDATQYMRRFVLGEISNNGILRLQSHGGSIHVNDLDMDNVRWAEFDAGVGASQIAGTLSNVTGTVDTPDARLRTPVGQKIYYRPALNPHLAAETYPLLGLDGVSAGGVLMPKPASGTLLIMR